MTDLEKWHRDIMLEAMAEGIEREIAAQERRRKDEQDMWDRSWDPGGRIRKKLRESEERWCEAENRRRDRKRKQMFPTPWEKDL